jgi:hypothetical protein
MSMKKVFGLLLMIVVLSSCSGTEHDFIEYRAKDDEFTKVYGENVYTQITFGNKLNPNALMAILCDEKGWNVIGKLTDGELGMASIVEGTYSIQNNYVILNWDTQHALELPKKLKIDVEFEGSKLNTSVNSLTDENNGDVYNFIDAWNAGEK